MLRFRTALQGLEMGVSDGLSGRLQWHSSVASGQLPVRPSLVSTETPLSPWGLLLTPASFRVSAKANREMMDYLLTAGSGQVVEVQPARPEGWAQPPRRR